MASNQGGRPSVTGGYTFVRAAASQPIRIDEIYPLAEFRKRTGLGRAAIRSARRKGLRISKHGRNRYVSGLDWAEFLRMSPVTVGSEPRAVSGARPR